MLTILTVLRKLKVLTMSTLHTGITLCLQVNLYYIYYLQYNTYATAQYDASTIHKKNICATYSPFLRVHIQHNDYLRLTYDLYAYQLKVRTKR